MKRAGLSLVVGLLAACSGGGEPSAASGPQDLETAAVDRGLIRDPADSDLTGLFARDGDRLCAVPQAGGYRIGIYADFGETLNCAAQGRAVRSGQRLSIDLRGKDDARCRFDAQFDGDGIVFPASLPAECAAICPTRASFAAMTVERLSETEAEARAARTPDGARLCGD